MALARINARNVAAGGIAATAPYLLGELSNLYNSFDPGTRQEIRNIPFNIARNVRRRLDMNTRSRGPAQYSGLNTPRRRTPRRGGGSRVPQSSTPSRIRTGRRVAPMRTSSFRRAGYRLKRTAFKRGIRRMRRRRGGFSSVIWRKLCTPMIYKNAASIAVAGSANLRAYYGITMGNETMLKALAAKRPSNFLFNTAIGTSSTATLQDPGGSNYKLCVSKFLQKFSIQNRGNAPMQLKVYECLARHDIGNGAVGAAPTTAITNMFVDALDLPTYVGQSLSNRAPGQAVVPTGVTSHYKHPAHTPYMSHEFCGAFRIVRTHNFVLAPNEVMNKSFRLKRKIVSGQRLEAASAYEYMANYTKVLLFTWVGGPTDDGTISNQGKAKEDLFLEWQTMVDYHFSPAMESLYNLSYTVDNGGDSTTYGFNPAAFTQVVPAAEVVETVASGANTVAATAP
nr:MAG: capsid protein [Cressdnaviricota sp.]